MKLQRGDLVEIEICEHDTIPKKYAIFGRFKGSRKKMILARIGEGEDDPRSQETIEMTATSVAESIQHLYAMNSYLRQTKRRE